MKPSYFFKGIALVLIILLMTACGQNNTAMTDGGGNAASVGPLGRFDPPITIISFRTDVSAAVHELLPDGDTLLNNPWSRAYYNELGIHLHYDWVVPLVQFDQRFGLAVATGDLPDVFRVNNMIQLNMLLERDLIMDLTDIFEEWATPLTKEIVHMDGGLAMRTATFDGRLMAIPETDSLTDAASMIWIRQDWLDKLRLPRPRNMAELINTAEAFVHADISGNGTYGIAFKGDLLSRGNAEAAGFMAGFHAYLDGWIQDGEGSLVFGSVQPEMRNAIASFADMFKRGLINPNFGIMNTAMVSEDIAAGRIGISFGRHWNALSPLPRSKEDNAKANWVAIPLVSVDERQARSLLPNPVPSYFVVNRDAQHPEAAIMMINLWNDKFFNRPDLDHALYGGDLIHLPIFRTWTPTKNIDARIAVTAALESGDTSQLDPEQLFYYRHIRAYLYGSDDTLGWSYYRVFGPEGSQWILQDILDSGAYVFDEFFGPPTPTMVTRWAVLTDMKLDTFMRIITGAAPIEEFDVFVESWFNLGGEQITAEVNEWFNMSLEG